MDWCKKMDWGKNRAVVFLDPYGMQVDWNLLVTIAKTHAIDLWLLFPLGMGVNRMLRKDGKLSDAWNQTLNRIFGDNSWENIFYKKRSVQTLFGEEENLCKDAGFEDIARYFINERLGKAFEGKVVKEPLFLCNSKNSPLYLLCFASGAKKGSDTAIKIAKNIIERESGKR